MTLDPARPVSPLRVGIVGFGWRGRVHARAFSRLRQHCPDSPLRPELVAVAASGRHRWIEKQAGRNAVETAGIADAVRTAGVQSAAGFDHRRARPSGRPGNSWPPGASGRWSR